jgi:hypothetical protein
LIVLRTLGGTQVRTLVNFSAICQIGNNPGNRYSDQRFQQNLEAYPVVKERQSA